MITKKEILEESIVIIFGREVANNQSIQNMISEFADEIISFDISEKEGWKTFQYETEEKDNSNILFNCNVLKFEGMLEAIHIFKQTVL